MPLTENDINSIAQLLKPLEQRLGNLEQTTSGLQQSFVNLEQTVGGLEQKVGGLVQSVGNLEQRVGNLEHTVEGISKDLTDFRFEVNAQFSEVQNNFDGLYAHDEKREQEYLLLRGQIARLEDRVDSLEKKVA